MLKTFFTFSNLKPKWKFKVNGILWRLHFSESDLIIGEDRNIENKSTSFFCVDAKSGKVLWRNLQIFNNWWIGIEKIETDKIFFHGFKKPDLPEHQKIIAVDINSSKIVWMNEEFSFYSSNKNFVFAFRDLFEKRIYYKLNSTNGEILEEIAELNDEILNSTTNQNKFNLQYPEILVDVESFKYKNQIQKILEKNNPVGNIEYQILNDKIIFNFHTSSNKLLDNKLFVLKDDGKILFEETIVSKSEYPAPDSFFIKDNLLYFVKNRNSLISILLN